MYLCVTFERERGREAYSSGKHVLIPIVKVIFHVLERGKGKLLLYNNCELSLLSTIPPPTTTTAKEVQGSAMAGYCKAC
jgi:hypothetical protein